MPKQKLAQHIAFESKDDPRFDTDDLQLLICENGGKIVCVDVEYIG